MKSAKVSAASCQSLLFDQVAALAKAWPAAFEESDACTNRFSFSSSCSSALLDAGPEGDRGEEQRDQNHRKRAVLLAV